MVSFSGHAVFDGKRLTGGFSEQYSTVTSRETTGTFHSHTRQNALLEQQQ
jgi:hypothetical protein